MVTLTTCLVAEPQQYINQVHFSPLFYLLGRHTDTQLTAPQLPILRPGRVRPQEIGIRPAPIPRPCKMGRGSRARLRRLQKKKKKTRISASTRGLELQAIATAPLRVTLRYSTASRNASLRHDGLAVVEPIPAAPLCFFTMLQALERKASTAPSASA